MALVLANRVQESATANTTVSFTLTGAVLGFQTFAVIGDTNTTYYSATDTAGNWEVGLGTYSTTGPTLTRTTIYASSNTGSAVTFSGAVNVFVTYPSGKSVNLDGSGNVSALGTVASGTWQGSTIGVAYGGTGVTASSGANSVVLRDANENITVNRLNQGLQTITASGGTTVLTAASDFNQALVGTGGHTFQLPDATTLTDTTTFQFNNNATGTLTIIDYASATVGAVAAGGSAGIALLSNATVGGTWDVHGYIPENVTWGSNSLYLNSTIVTGGTWQGGTIQPGYGGTGLTTFVGANNALYSTGASALTAGTLPPAAGGTGATATPTNGQLLIGNGTNYSVATLGSGTGISTTTGSGTLTINNTGVTSFSAGTTGLTPSTGTTGDVTLAGTLAIANGGTGQTTANTAFNALAPSQATNAGKYLTTDGTNTSWAAAGATISNDTSTATAVYPLFSSATSGTATTLNTSNAKLLYTPSTGEFQSSEVVANNGIFANSQTVSANYSIPSGSNGGSFGPVTVASGITVTIPSGSVWTVV
jgi:hypothetical protein